MQAWKLQSFNSVNSSSYGSGSEISHVDASAGSGSEIFIAQCKSGHRSLLLIIIICAVHGLVEISPLPLFSLWNHLTGRMDSF